MRRIPRLPWLAAIATAAVGFCSSDSIAQPGIRLPRLAASATNRASNTTPVLQADPLLEQLDLAIEVTGRRYLKANEHSPWQIFHGILALKRDFQLKLGDEKVNAIDWIATSDPRFDNEPLLQKTAHGGKFHSFTRPWAFEGHPSQFLALMSQSDLPADFSFKVGHERITIADMVQNTMKEVNSKEEVTWVLWALQHHLNPNAQWTNQFGEPWSIEKLVQIETAAPVVGAACGGNHRLFALTRTRDKHLKFGGKLDGVWAQADLKIRQHVELARQLQNSDGSFSAKFYQSPAVTSDLNERFNTTGHTLEFLSIGLPDSRLNEPWVHNAASLLARELIQHRQRLIDCGPLYHSLNSLIIYRERLRKTLPSSLAVSRGDTINVTQTPALASTPAPLANVPTALPVKNRLEAVTAPVLTEVRRPAGNTTPITSSTDVPKPTSAARTDNSVPATSATPTLTDTAAAKLPTVVPLVTTLKTMSPGRVVHIRPIPQPVADARQVRPLSDVAGNTYDELLLPLRDPESFDSTVGTLKPRFDSPPAASRVSVSNVAARNISTVTVAQPTTPIEDAPASALAPVNREVH